MAISNRVDSQKTEAFSAERELLTNAIRSGWANGDGETEQRHTIRQLCTVAGNCPHLREQLLITFRTLIISAADKAEIPSGRKRNALLGRLATIFVEELYSVRLEKRDRSDGNRHDVA